jgi:hypothetical protein
MTGKKKIIRVSKRGVINEGAPTNYRHEHCELVDEYLAKTQDSRFQLIKTNGENSTTYENKITVKLPTVYDFAKTYFNSTDKVMNDWANKYPAFRKALDKIVKEQEKRLVNYSLAGEYNSTIAKLILSANHGYVEKTEQKQTIKGELTVKDQEQISKAIQDL